MYKTAKSYIKSNRTIKLLYTRNKASITCLCKSATLFQHWNCIKPFINEAFTYCTSGLKKFDD